MVAPTRTPQARGVKCELCKKILATATWLDQTKLAKNVEVAQQVLEFVRRHHKSNCPCIPKDIENLLVGSTYFEIHRLVMKQLDAQVHKRQYEYFVAAKQKASIESSKRQNQNINDCNESNKSSRFKIYLDYNDKKLGERSEFQLKHLIRAIDYWKLAMEDLTHPFNSKLALRLGLTHHVIYACYLFKYYKVLDYQLITANLLLNLFKSIEGVTTYAIIHANYILVRALMDCNQMQLARQHLKQATKISNYSDKTHYEPILLTCVACELGLLDDGDTYTILDELSSLAVIKSDDKLQHYFARTLAISIIIKYIHCFRARSDLCFEFYHTFRYICAIIRRCYENCFEIVLSEKDTNQPIKSTEVKQQNQILDHSWIRFAVCDFVFSTFDQLTNFYIRAGQPENLELLYNGLNLIAYRSGSCYWQSRMASLGVGLDLLCDKYDHASEKLDSLSHLIGHTSDNHLMNLIRLDLEVGLLSLLDRKGTVINKDVLLDLMKRARTCRSSLMHKINQIELYDCKSNSYSKTTSYPDNEDGDLVIIGDNIIGHLSLKLFKIAIAALMRTNDSDEAKELIVKLENQFERSNYGTLEYNDCQDLLEILVDFLDIEKSDQHLLETASTTNLFLRTHSDLSSIESQLSMLTINGESSGSSRGCLRKRPTKTTTKTKIGHLTRRKGLYDVASRSEENLFEGQQIRFFDTIGTVKNFSTLSQEEILVSYLRNSEPNPDYLKYRRAHEMMFCHYIKKEPRNHDQLMYHFSESSSSNTMRYRWMMFEEQQSSPYDSPTTVRVNNHLKHLGFCNSLVNPEKTLKSLIRSAPDECNLLQFKYILERKASKEHLLVICYNNGSEPVYVHLSITIASDDDFFEALTKRGDDPQIQTIPVKFSKKIEEAKKTLFYTSNRSRSEARQKIETELGIMLHDIENEWLGPFRFMLCGRVCDQSYTKFLDALEKQTLAVMNGHTCNSSTGLRMMLENAPLLNRAEFCQAISSLFNCPSSIAETRECFNTWLKSIEKLVAERAPGMNKTTYLQTLARGQVGLILDKDLELLPLESLPIFRILNQGIFRVPSLRLYGVIASRNSQMPRVDANETAYMLDPASNLAKTRDRFETKLRLQKSWTGTISRPPTAEQLEQWFTTKQIYLFIGHGAGTAYYNQLCKSRGLSAMKEIKPVPIVMGCSSGRVLAEGPRLESFGISWVFIFRGAPAYVGLLWDVTDTDIDRFLDSLLSKWLGPRWQKSNAEKEDVRDKNTKVVPLTEAMAQVRHVCQHKFLVGSTSVVYGLPVWPIKT